MPAGAASLAAPLEAGDPYNASKPSAEEMAAFAVSHPHVDWRLVLSEEAGAAPAGLVHDAVREGLLKDHPDLAALEFYVCGPPAMLAATRGMLRELGVDERMNAFDDFKI